MATALRLRRGTTAQHTTFTGAAGEVTVDTDKKVVVVHDGSTAGGIPLAKESGSAITTSSATITGGTINNATIGATTASTGAFTTLSASTSVTTPSVTNAGTLALSATGANIATISTNGSERLRVTSGGQVGVNTTSPVTYTNYKGITLEDTTGSFVHLRNTANTHQAELGLNGGTGAAYLATYTSSLIQFLTNNVERARFPAAGGFQAKTTISVGDATPSNSGAGITFPATQSASTDANTLDDYEQGTWTPSVGGNATYSTQVGRYTKIGRMVYVQAVLTIGTLGTGATRIVSGLPFATSLQQDVESGISVAYFQGSAASFVLVNPYATGSEVRINSATAAATQTSTNNFFTNATTIEFGGWYQAAD